MTNFEKFRLESFNSHAISEGKVKKGIAAAESIMAGETFADSLNGITSQTVDAWTAEDGERAVSEVSAVPTEWTYNGYWSASAVVKAVDEYLESVGVAYDRTPSYELTDEQRKWLESRHDMEALKTANVSSKEFANFMGDLYYLGAVSAKDVNNACVPIAVLPTAPGTMSYLGQYYSELNSDCPALEFIRNSLAVQQTELDLMNADTRNYAWEVKAMQDHVDSRQRIYEMLLKYLGDAIENSEVSDKLNIDLTPLIEAMNNTEDQGTKNRDDVIIEYVGKLIEIRRAELEYLQKKHYEDLINGKTELQKLHNFLNGKNNKADNWLEDIFMIFPPEVYSEISNVTDASEQLSEDFGAML